MNAWAERQALLPKGDVLMIHHDSAWASIFDLVHQLLDRYKPGWPASLLHHGDAHSFDYRMVRGHLLTVNADVGSRVASNSHSRGIAIAACCREMDARREPGVTRDWLQHSPGVRAG